MNTLVEGKASVTFESGQFFVRLGNGVVFSFPIAGNWRLEGATPEQLVHVEVDEEGLHWPDIDEDLSFAGLLRGDWGQHVRGEKTYAEAQGDRGAVAMAVCEGGTQNYQTAERSNGQTVERGNGDSDLARKGAEGDAR